MHVSLQQVSEAQVEAHTPTTTKELRQKVERAHRFITARGQRCSNARLRVSQILPDVTEDAMDELHRAMMHTGFSMRTRERILRLSRTVADLEESRRIDSYAMSRAVHFRVLEREVVS